MFGDRAPDTDYSQLEARTAAKRALHAVRRQLGKTYRPLINGQWVAGTQAIASVNPSNPDEAIGRVELADGDDVEKAIAAAKAAFPDWKQTPASDRAVLLHRVADLMSAKREELSAWIVLEVGKPLAQADADVSEAIDFCRYYAREMERLDRGTAYDVPGETNRYHYKPRGLVTAIAPWNFPLAIPTGMVMAALVAGNCTILKPAEQSSVVAAKLAELLVEAGVPAGVFQFLPGIGETIGSALVKHPDIHAIVFTGSQAVGCQIYADAAVLQPGQTHLKRVIAEMGGKNAIVIDSSADLDRSVQGVVRSAFGYSGQKCSACSRAIVLDSIYDVFLRRLMEAARSLHVGSAEDFSTHVGPVIDAEARDRIRAFIKRGREEAEVVLEGNVPDTGYFISPTIFSSVPPDAAIAQQEIFGPVLAVTRARDFDEAIEIANGTPYALTGGLYSRTPAHIERAKTEFEVGNLYINRTITGAIVERQPFGGFKLSGVGSKAGGSDYLLQFMEPRTITENVQRQGFAPVQGS